MSEAFRTDVTGNGALKAGAASVIHDLEELSKDVARLAGATTSAAGAQMRSAQQRLSRLSQEAGARASRSATYVSEQIREHPGVAIGVSLGTGLLLGMLMSRRHLDRGGTRTHTG